ncbi:MAG: tRNA (N6-isopentenyl adenosine(37)-C2)-methylthiotransferase MiaB [Spirochaetales bacterium]|nr:tRNA (N6-isopentenyl adenosine(37)-C2)-methylthiotransferase MiaB [Spirochaetales bacterium]
MSLKKIWIETYGCQMNKAESRALQILLDRKGWILAENETNADIVLLNTCSVRNKAEERIWGRIGHFRHLKKTGNFKLIITGCMAERLKQRFIKETPDIDIVVGNFQKQNLVEICEKAINERLNGKKHPQIYADNGEYSFYSLHEKTDFKAFVPIMHGCNNYCSYCIVPYVRGREISRPPEEILSEISFLEERNVKEITLLGQNVNSYIFTNNCFPVDFSGILEEIITSIKKIKWIRFLTSHPKDFPEKLIAIISGSPYLCHHIHLPVQHGSDSILKKMNRGYTISHYLHLIENIKKRISDIAITTDILIGFPGETESDFYATYNFMKEIEFDDAFMYRYSVREGTKASLFPDDIPERVKLDRLGQIIELQQGISKKKKLKKIGKTLNVLVEKVSKKKKGELLGRTEYDDMVIFPGSSDKIGSFCRVTLTSLQGNTLKGEEILCPGD